MNKYLAYLNAPVPAYGAFALAAGATAAGIVGTYFIMKQRNEATFQERLDKEVAATKKFYGTVVQPKPASPSEIVEEIEIKEYTVITKEYKEGDSFEPPDEDGVFPHEKGEIHEIVRNVWTDADGDWDYEKELENRDPDFPYIISHDEFVTSEYESRQLTFYEGDGILADDDDEHVPNIDNIIGDENLTRFGYGSRDDNVVYVRNDKLGLDFEICRVEEKYSVAVMGAEYLEHEDKRQLRRFRDSDY